MRGVRTATNCSRLGMSALSHDPVKTGKAQNQANVVRLARKRSLPILELLPLPSFSRTPPSPREDQLLGHSAGSILDPLKYKIHVEFWLAFGMVLAD